MAIVVKISKSEQRRLQKYFTGYGAKKGLIERKITTYTTINKLLKYREADDTTISKLSAYLGFNLELEQNKIPA